ncbi:MAG: Vitamin B12-binding protein [Bryobacteraceae bacterium]|nr:Vitamin B12-binding protein [Bryobacteraceae bacterium]
MRVAAGLLLAASLFAQQRIISTTPSVTEILFALGLGPRVVGVTTFCRYPEEARRLPKIGTFLDPSMETILGLRPDLVIVQKNPVRLTERLRAVGLRVIEVDPESMEGVHQTIAEIARTVGIEKQGRELSARIRSGIEKVKRVTAKLPRRRVVFFVGRTPGTLDGLIAAAKGSYLTELLADAGGENIFEDSPAAYPKVSLEELLARDPEVILDMGDSTLTGAITEEHKREVIRLWDRYQTLSAVRNHRVYPVADDRFVIPGPRMVEALRIFAKLLHPEARW